MSASAIRWRVKQGKHPVTVPDRGGPEYSHGRRIRKGESNASTNERGYRIIRLRSHLFNLHGDLSGFLSRRIDIITGWCTGLLTTIYKSFNAKDIMTMIDRFTEKTRAIIGKNLCPWESKKAGYTLPAS